MGTVTSLDTGESWEVPDCGCMDALRGKVAQGESVVCEHGWDFKNVDCGPYGWVLAYRRAGTDDA